MDRELAKLRTVIDTLKGWVSPTPLVKYEAPAGDAEAVELFARACSGDAEAQDRLRVLIRDRQWVTWIGDLGRQATRQLVWKAAGGDRVWEAGITARRPIPSGHNSLGRSRQPWRNCSFVVWSTGGWRSTPWSWN